MEVFQILLLICSKVGLPQLTKLKGSVNLTNQAVFDTGERVNVKMKALANSENTILEFDEKNGVNDCYEYFSKKYKKYRRVNYGRGYKSRRLWK